MHRRIIAGIVLLTLACCTGVPDQRSPESISPGTSDALTLYARASSRAATRDFDEAFESLEASMEAGYATPSDVLVADTFDAMLDDPAWRPRVRDLLEANAREHTLTMVRADEPGEPMILTVRVVGGVNEPPEPATPPIVRAGVVVGLVQVNDAGFYQPWEQEGEWNPRLYSFAVTDENGTIVVRTVRPAHYAPEYQAEDEPAHAHYNIVHQGTLLRASEFYFDDDPRMVGEARREAEAARVPIATVARGHDGVLHAEVTIPARGLR